MPRKYGMLTGACPLPSCKTRFSAALTAQKHFSDHAQAEKDTGKPARFNPFGVLEEGSNE